MRRSDLLRYGLWAAVVRTALRNRAEYGVPTAWLTHLAGNAATLLLPDLLRLLQRGPLRAPPVALRPLFATIQRRVAEDPRYAGYVAPLALGFIASYPEISIYHGRWAEHTLYGFGIDSVPHASAAYALARLVSETLTTLHEELPNTHRLAGPARRAAQSVDVVAAAIVVAVTLLWEISEYLAHQAEVSKTGRPASEVNMQWSWPDAITDSISNLAGLLAAIAVRRAQPSASEHAHVIRAPKPIHAAMDGLQRSIG